MKPNGLPFICIRPFLTENTSPGLAAEFSTKNFQPSRFSPLKRSTVFCPPKHESDSAMIDAAKYVLTDFMPQNYNFQRRHFKH